MAEWFAEFTEPDVEWWVAKADEAPTYIFGAEEALEIGAVDRIVDDWGPRYEHLLSSDAIL
jgi:hypothetical protein